MIGSLTMSMHTPLSFYTAHALAPALVPCATCVFSACPTSALFLMQLLHHFTCLLFLPRPLPVSCSGCILHAHAASPAQAFAPVTEAAMLAQAEPGPLDRALDWSSTACSSYACSTSCSTRKLMVWLLGCSLCTCSFSCFYSSCPCIMLLHPYHCPCIVYHHLHPALAMVFLE